MTNPEAKNILALYRPGSADEKDPLFQEALHLAKTDPELARCFKAHCESYVLVRQKLQSVPVPLGLKEQILSERKIHRPIFKRYWPHFLATAAAVVVLLSLAFHFLPFHRTNLLASYRENMTQLALSGYGMSLTTNDPALIRDCLKNNSAPADYTLPAGLKTADAVGCLACGWDGKMVSMICFKSGRPLPQGSQSDLWFFVIDRQNVADAPPPGGPVFAQVDKATTASWSDGNKTYLLATVGDEAFLRKYLP